MGQVTSDTYIGAFNYYSRHSPWIVDFSFSIEPEMLLDVIKHAESCGYFHCASDRDDERTFVKLPDNFYRTFMDGGQNVIVKCPRRVLRALDEQCVALGYAYVDSDENRHHFVKMDAEYHRTRIAEEKKAQANRENIEREEAEKRSRLTGVSAQFNKAMYNSPDEKVRAVFSDEDMEEATKHAEKLGFKYCGTEGEDRVFA